jgi:hypothetical protein
MAAKAALRFGLGVNGFGFGCAGSTCWATPLGSDSTAWSCRIRDASDSRVARVRPLRGVEASSRCAASRARITLLRSSALRTAMNEVANAFASRAAPCGLG